MIDIDASDGWGDDFQPRKKAKARTRSPSDTRVREVNDTDIEDWTTDEHSRGVGEKDTTSVSLLDIVDPDEDYNEERAEAQKRALEKTAEADLRALEDLE